MTYRWVTRSRFQTSPWTTCGACWAWTWTVPPPRGNTRALTGAPRPPWPTRHQRTRTPQRQPSTATGTRGHHIPNRHPNPKHRPSRHNLTGPPCSPQPPGTGTSSWRYATKDTGPASPTHTACSPPLTPNSHVSHRKPQSKERWSQHHDTQRRTVENRPHGRHDVRSQGHQRRPPPQHHG